MSPAPVPIPVPPLARLARALKKFGLVRRHTPTRTRSTLAGDQRGVAGLPVRLVVAFVVGVASLGVMLNMVAGVGTLATSELDVRPQPDVLHPGAQTVDVTAVDADGRPVAGATIVISRGSATLAGAPVVVAETGPNGTATVRLDARLAPNRVQGTLAVAVKPPAGTQYTDDRENTHLLVVVDE